MTAAGPEPSLPSGGSRVSEVSYQYSPQFPQVLERGGCSVLVSTYQAGQLIGIGVFEGELTFSFRGFDKVMGLAVGADRIAVADRTQIWSLDEHSEVAPMIDPAGRYDRCWLPRSSRVVGDIQCHEIAWGTTNSGEPDLWIVNTLFSCLASLAPGYNFVPRWRPPFVSQLVPQDRCHLNGLAMRDGTPAFVTVLAPTDEPSGWRTVRDDTGAVLDVSSGEVVTSGLSMPHSPRWDGRSLYVLNSGMGRLERVDLATGDREAVALVPGYARGLALHGDLAFIGLSRIRETAVFGRAPVAAHHAQLKCGLGIIELSTGNTLATLQFDNGVEEVFDVQVIPGARCPNFGSSGNDENDLWLLPSPSIGDPGR